MTMGNKRKKKGKSVKLAQRGQLESQEQEFKKHPHTFVFKHGKVGKNIRQLVDDMRQVMEPYTAAQLQVKKKNVLKDFVSVAGLLNVTHFIVFSKSETSINLRVMRLPRGPTLSFKVMEYSHLKDVVSSLRHHCMDDLQFKNPPLIIMNNFGGDGMHFKLMSTMFQNMFPALNVTKVKLKDVRRCVLMNYNESDQSIDFRHYNIRAVPVGMSRGVKKIIRDRIPNMSKYSDISDYLIKNEDVSESEAELDGPQNEVTLPQEVVGKGNVQASKSAVRLTEIGPRMKLRLVKVQEGLNEGDILFHQFVKKTPEEVEALRKAREKKKCLKEQRKQKQKENVEKKAAAKEEHRQRSLAGMKIKSTGEGSGSDDEDNVEEPVLGGSNEESDDATQDDIEYFKKEVGHAPDPELFPRASGKKRKLESRQKSDKTKKHKMDGDSTKSSKKQTKMDKKSKFNKKDSSKKLKPKGEVDDGTDRAKKREKKSKGKGQKKFSEMNPVEKMLKKKELKMKKKKKGFKIHSKKGLGHRKR